MASPGGWSSVGLEYLSEQPEVQLFQLDSRGINQLPIETLASAETFHDIVGAMNNSVCILESRGGRCVGINSSLEFFQRARKLMQFPEQFMDQITGPGSLSRMDFYFERSPSGSSKRPIAVNIGFRWGLGHSHWIVAFARYELEKSNMNVILSSRGILDYNIRDCSTLGSYTAANLLARAKDFHDANPLIVFELLLGCCEKFLDMRSQKHNLEMLEIGSSLPALISPELAQWLSDWGLQDPRRSEKKIDRLFAKFNSVTWDSKCCQELLDICSQYREVTQDVARNFEIRPPTALVGSILHRVKIHHYLLEYLEQIIQMQFTHQHNHLMQQDTEATINISKASHEIAIAARKDGKSMKTIAYLTLIFLPATFVSAIFSTSVFDFQNWKHPNQGHEVVSPGWWVFVVICATTSAATFAGWYYWHEEKEKKIGRDSNRRMNKKSNGSTDMV